MVGKRGRLKVGLWGRDEGVSRVCMRRKGNSDRMVEVDGVYWDCCFCSGLLFLLEEFLTLDVCMLPYVDPLSSPPVLPLPPPPLVTLIFSPTSSRYVPYLPGGLLLCNCFVLQDGHDSGLKINRWQRPDVYWGQAHFLAGKHASNTSSITQMADIGHQFAILMSASKITTPIWTKGSPWIWIGQPECQLCSDAQATCM